MKTERGRSTSTEPTGDFAFIEFEKKLRNRVSG